MKNFLLVTDLDGTLLDDKKILSQENIDAINDFRSKGGEFTLATGRMLEATRPYIEKLGIDIPVILYNGAGIYSPKLDNLIWQENLTDYHQLLDRLVDLSTEYELGIHIYQDNYSYWAGSKDLIDKSDQKEKVKSIPYSQLDLNRDIIKILLIGGSVEVLDECRKIVEEENFPATTFFSDWNYFEILPPTANKGIALAKLVELIDGQDKTIITAGNNRNDLDMLHAADYGFYVKNAHKDLHRADLHPTVDNESHAIADIINNFIYKLPDRK